MSQSNETTTTTQVTTAAEQTPDPKGSALLKGIAEAFSQGKNSEAKHLLRAGEKAHKYVLLRLSLGHSRDAARKTIEGRLTEETGLDVDANELIHAYWAFTLLGDGLDKPELPWSITREFNPLVERVTEEKAESWRVRPEVSEEAKALFAKACTDSPRMPRGDVSKAVKALTKLYLERHILCAEAAKEQATAKALEATERATKATTAEDRKAAQAEAKAASDEASRQQTESNNAAKRLAKLNAPRSTGGNANAPSANPSAADANQRPGREEMSAFQKTFAALCDDESKDGDKRRALMMVQLLGRKDQRIRGAFARFLEALPWDKPMMAVLAQFLAETDAGGKVRARALAMIREQRAAAEPSANGHPAAAGAA